ncbi:T3SS regulon anti-activator ExsD family protein [Vibrio harveyi]|nr:T3SS regulon anti-activator ExsD family protein [Vibrio harveyi]MCG9586559.1 T3SS regulon anti-activator ExsD family protein [Vibrio harveyi]MCG9610051.1 T3SS regulon anti-activator ExsD family protein [Vibrio harveyi]MCG9671661.1 T3SS regulon anti-activator ExsD family protein [Vibrio harveyi]
MRRRTQMKKQHWRRRSLFPNNIVTQRKVTVLQRGARYEGLSQSSQEPNVVNVNHRQLLSEGVLSYDQLSLLQRLLDRNVVDCLCASQLIKTYQKLGTSLDRFAMRLFLEVGGQLSDNRALSTFEQRLDYINHRVGYRFNLASPKTLILSMYLTLNEWVNQQTDQTVLHDSIKLEQLINQLSIQKEYWLRLSGEVSCAIFAEQQLELIKSQQSELHEQLSVLNEQQNQVVESQRALVEEWKPTLEKLKGLSEYRRTSDKFISEWKIWCSEVRVQVPELNDIWDACDLVYSDLNAVAKIWQWFQDMQTVGSVDHYYFDIQSNQCGQACNHLSQI